MANELEQTYLDFLQHILDNGVKKKTVLARARLVYLVIKCVLTYQKDFLYLRQSVRLSV